MLRLMLVVYSLAATVLAGAAVTAVLVIGRVDLPAILFAAGSGAVAALPIAILVARKLVRP